jgi:hypothetical protein
MPGTWKTPLNTPSFNVGTMLLLTDGSVLAQDTGTRHWWRLTPDAAGQYINGTWRQVSSSRNAPLYFASAVLRDGKVFIAGGEINNGQPADLCAAELYDPVADRWTDLPTPDDWTAIGDAPCCVLPDGKLLLGSINDNRTARFDPETLSWTATGTKRNATSNEETWTLLPDGSVMTAECFGHPASERYANGTWIANGITDPHLVEDASHEIGPAILLADGRVLAIGASGGTSLFTPNLDQTQPGTWAPGQTFPQEGGGQLAAKDAPACLLPNGRVLCAVGAVDGTPDSYGAATIFFEYDPATNALARLPQQPANAGVPPYMGRLLLLPNGMVLFANGTSALMFYESDGAPNPDWQPFVSDWPTEIEAGTAGQLVGTQFNGLSQACAYGDDANMATNYPIVRLRSMAANGSVIYCRTFNHSGMAVATAAAAQFTWFMVPSDIPFGRYELFVIANGIASVARSISVIAPTARSELDLTPEERELQHELFWRDLNEVHLRMDFVSGRSDKSLADLKDVADPTDPTKKMDAQAVVEAVCKIRFPPTGSATSRAQQAALLLSAKDRLNALSAPARGLTIAYTAMFAGVALPESPGKESYLAHLLRRLGCAIPNGADAPSPSRHFSAFATHAYPNLTRSALRFRHWFAFLPWIAFLWAICTALVYWDVALSTRVLNRLTQLQQPAQTLAAATSGSSNASVTAVKLVNDLTCDLAASPTSPAVQNIELQHACKDLAALTERHLWKHPVGWVMYWLEAKKGMSGSVDKPREQLASSVVDLFTNYIVPMVFGLLGTLAGVVRTIWNKARESILSPRDERLAIASVPLGLVAGLAVGLIVSPSSSSTQMGAVTLSATALAFLAGYGADAFFSMVDDLLKRVFALGGAGAGK